MHWLRRAVAAAVVTGGLALAAPAQAQTGERIVSYDVDLRIEPSGSLLVTEQIAYDFGGAKRHGIFRDLQVRVRYDNRYDRIYPVHVLQVSGSPGTPDHYELENVGSKLRIRIGDPDRTISGEHNYTIVYRVGGALNGFGDHDELYWNAIGTQWAAPVERASARVSAPVAISRVACYVGPEGSTAPCGSSGTDGTTASFAAPRLGPSQGLTVVVGLPTGAVPAPRPVLDERWSLVRAFSVTPGTLAVVGVVLLLVLLGLGWLFRAVGGDRRASDGTAGAAVEWAPPDGIRPGQAGLLVNGTVRPLDVIATLVDLAIRGYLRIEELPSHRKRTKPDWRLVQLKAADHHLLGYERELFYGLFSSHGNGARVRLSALNKKFYERFDRVRLALYQDAMQRHWFTHRPDRVRWWWAAGGVSMTVLGIAVAVLVVWQTHFGLAAVPLLLAGPIVILRVRSLISRTPEGAALRRRVVGLHTYLKTAGAGAGGTGAPDQFSSYLPYAMVLGLTEQWTRAPALAGAPPQTDWYGSPAPWSPDRFSSRMHDFAGTSAGTFTSSPPSASGSSGFDSGSSGGGGGDGGGSW